MEFKSHGLVEFQATDTYQSSDSIRVIYKAKWLPTVEKEDEMCRIKSWKQNVVSVVEKTEL